LGPWLVGIFRGTIVFFLLSGFSRWFFDFYLPGALPTVLLLIGIYLMALLLGGFVCILVLQFGQKAEISAWAFAYLVILFAGIYYPVTQLPKGFYYVSLGIPLTYFLDYFRSFYGRSAMLSLPLLKGFGLVCLGIGGVFAGLQLSLQRARKTGVLLRLSE
jgi:ABC-2 type transport system permease protein